MLTLSSVTKRYRDVHAVENLSFSVNGGEIVGLLGPNGAGKTTTIRCICGILTPEAGTIVVDGYDISTSEIDAKRLMAFIPEVPNPYEALTVREHIQFVAMCYDRMDLFESHIDELLDRFELREKEQQLVATLSKGMKQKLAIACAFVHGAKVFLCDEPMIGLDPKGQHQLKAELQRLRAEGCAVLVSTHLLDTAEKLCDRVIIMQKGRKVAEGTLHDLRARAQVHADAKGVEESLEQVFLRLTAEEQTELRS